MNIRFPLINYLFNIRNEKEKMIKTELEVNEELKRYELIEKKIKQKKIKEMKKDVKNKIFNYFLAQNNKS